MRGDSSPCSGGLWEKPKIIESRLGSNYGPYHRGRAVEMTLNVSDDDLLKELTEKLAAVASLVASQQLAAEIVTNMCCPADDDDDDDDDDDGTTPCHVSCVTCPVFAVSVCSARIERFF